MTFTGLVYGFPKEKACLPVLLEELCLAGLLGGKIPFPAPFCALLTTFLAAG